RPFLARLPSAISLEETVSLLWVQPLLQESSSVTYFTRYGRSGSVGPQDATLNTIVSRIDKL
ncbi:MAG: hypothetical protein HN700_07060, partial [Verrucomicrobia bacterium]|nr:hypothetical protein [Verrucomicrobiota bacterium]